MTMSNRVRRIVVTGLLISALTPGLWAQAGGSDAVFKMIPADCLFCVRINGIDQTLGQLDQFLMGVSPMNLTIMVKMQLGQVLGNPMLAGLKTDGALALFAAVPSGEVKDPTVIAKSLSILVPVSDYSQFASSSPKIGKADSDGVGALEGTGMYVTNLGGYALIGPSASAGEFAATAKSVKAGPAKSLASALDAGELGAATKEPLWFFANIQALAKVLGPDVGEKIKQAAEGIAAAQAGAAPGMDMKPIMGMYASMAETFLKEGKSVVVTVTPKANVLVASTAVTALPGTPMADLLTKSSPSGAKDWKLLGYLEDGAMMNQAMSVDPACLAKLNQKGLDFLATLGGKKASDEEIKRIKAFADNVAGALGKETAITAFITPQAKSIFGAKYVFEVKDKDKWQKVFDEAAALLSIPTLSSLNETMGFKMSFAVQHGAATYQGVTIDSAKLTVSSKDPNSPQAQMMQKMYGGGFEYRMALVDRLGVMALGTDADANIKKLIDQAKAGGPKQASGEFKAAMDVLPEAKNADFVVTFNYLRVFSIMPALMPMPMPAVNFQSKSNLLLAGGADKGKVTVTMALPKEHLTEIVQAFQQIMMQQQQQQKTSTAPSGR